MNGLEILELSKNQIVHPELYAPPVTQIPEVDTPESAEAVLDRQRYENLLANTKPLREQYLGGVEQRNAGYEAGIEAERLAQQGVVIPEGPRPQAPIIQGAQQQSEGSVVNPLLAGLDKRLGLPVSKGPIYQVPEIKNVPETKPSSLEEEAERFKNLSPEDQMLGGSITPGNNTVNYLDNKIIDKTKNTLGTAYKVVNGKPYISKKYIEENKDKLEQLASDFGFESQKDLLRHLSTRGVNESVGSTKFGNKEFEGSKMTEVSTGKIKGKTLTLPDIWGKEELAKAKEVAESHGMTKEELFSFLAQETGNTYNPTVTNGIGATGLSQWTRTSAHDFQQIKKRNEELSKIDKPTPKQVKMINEKYPFVDSLPKSEREEALKNAQFELANMDLIEQLDFLDIYLEEVMRGKKGLEAAYSSVFAGNPNKNSTKLTKGNESLDTNKDGIVTKSEWMVPVMDYKQKILNVKLQEPTSAQSEDNPSSSNLPPS